MKYQVIVTKEQEGIPGRGVYTDHEIFKQGFEELDLAALVIFLNTPKTITDGYLQVGPVTVSGTGDTVTDWSLSNDANSS